MTKSEKQRWERQRAGGRARFLWRHVLFVGLPFGVAMTLFRVLPPLWEHKPALPLSYVVLQFAACTLGFGVFVGLVHWFVNETEYKRPAEDDEAR